MRTRERERERERKRERERIYFFTTSTNTINTATVIALLLPLLLLHLLLLPYFTSVCKLLCMYVYMQHIFLVQTSLAIHTFLVSFILVHIFRSYIYNYSPFRTFTFVVLSSSPKNNAYIWAVRLIFYMYTRGP